MAPTLECAGRDCTVQGHRNCSLANTFELVQTVKQRFGLNHFLNSYYIRRLLLTSDRLWAFFPSFFVVLTCVLIWIFFFSRYARGDHVERDHERYHGGLIDMLCDVTLDDQQRSLVCDAIHNFCYGKDGQSNKEDIIQHYYRVLRRVLLQCGGKDRELVLRRSANTLLCLLNIRADHDADDHWTKINWQKYVYI